MEIINTTRKPILIAASEAEAQLLKAACRAAEQHCLALSDKDNPQDPHFIAARIYQLMADELGRLLWEA